MGTCSSSRCYLRQHDERIRELYRFRKTQDDYYREYAEQGRERMRRALTINRKIITLYCGIVAWTGALQAGPYIWPAIINLLF